MSRNCDISAEGLKHDETIHHARLALRADGTDHGSRKTVGGPRRSRTSSARSIDSPYYKINPSGRVPYLMRDDGLGLEESAVVCRYLDHLDGNPKFELPEGERFCQGSRQQV
jgi:glutathione S-transferase